MNVKKYLSSVAKADRESLKTNKDDLFIEELVSQEEVVPQRIVSKKKMFAIGIPCVSLLLALVICLSIFLPADKEILYLAENYAYVDSSVAELNQDLKNVQLQIAADRQEVTVSKVYDSDSGDTLFYKVEVVTSELFPKNFSLIVVTNENYHYDNSTLNDGYKSEALNGNELRYSIEIDSTPELDIYTTEGEMQINSVWLYITYSEIVLSGMECSFLQTIEELIQFK